MNLALTTNIILAVIVFAAIVGLLAQAIVASRPLRAARVARIRAVRDRTPARARGYDRYDGLGA